MIDLDNPDFDDYLFNYYQILKESTLLKILKGRGARTLPIKLAKKILKKALKYQITDVALYTCEQLKGLYALDVSLQHKYEETSVLFWKLLETQKYEFLAIEYYERFLMPNIRYKIINPEMTKQLQVYIKELDAVPEKFRSEKFLRAYFLLKIFLPISLSDWNEAILVCDKALKYYKDNPIFPEKIIHSFRLQKISVLIVLNSYDALAIEFQEALSVAVNSHIWFKYKALQAQFYMQSQQYKKAWNIIKSALKNKNFNSLTPTNQEIWYIYNAYISFLEMVGQVELSPREKGAVRKFRMEKFLNEVPTFSKDKQGMNVQILILQVLMLLQEGKLDKCNNRIEALLKYKTRQLDKNKGRTEIFINVISCVKKGRFLKEKVVKKATPLLHSLKQAPINLMNKSYKLEIVPYPILWNHINKLLT